MVNVHLLASKKNVLNDIESLRKIIDVIKQQGHTIVDNWIDETYDLRVGNKDEGGIKDIDWTSIYTANLQNIAKADVIIAEASFDTFGVGYQVAVAVQQKKPVLLLRSENSDTDTFAMGVADSWVERQTYNDQTLGSIIEKFLDHNEISNKDMRFNFFIDRHIYNYLRWAALRSGKTKAEILRSLINHEIDRNRDDI